MIGWGESGSLLLLLVFTFPNVPICGNIIDQDMLDIYAQLTRPGTEQTHCGRYDYSPEDCRARGCFFNCATQRCDVRSTSVCNPDKEMCQNNCFDVCACRRLPTCEFNIAGGNCFTIFPKGGMECRRNLFQGWECLQEGKFYVEAGVPCKMTRSSGTCSYVEQIRAVNLNGGNFTNDRGIRYREDKVIPVMDENNTRREGKFDGSLKGYSGNEGELYSTYIHGGKRGCISFMIPFKFVGYYELTIRTGVFLQNGTGQRLFTVKFNEVPILLELDLFKVVGGYARPADFVLMFHIDEDGYLYPRGYYGTKIRDGHVLLSFCSSECNLHHERGYIVSAFHILRIRTNEPEVIDKDGSTTEEGYELSSTTESGEMTTESGEMSTVGPGTSCFVGEERKCLQCGGTCTPCSDDDRSPTSKCPPTGKDQVCAQYDGNICGCKLEGCEYNVVRGSCLWGETSCDSLILDEDQCRKEGTFSGHGGVICPQSENIGNCEIDKVILAVNINGLGYTDTQGITYEMDSPTLYNDRFSVRRGLSDASCKDDTPISGVTEDGLQIYSSLIYGKSNVSPVNQSICVSYPVTITENGRFLLTINTVDTIVDTNKTRSFNVKLQGITILPEVDLVRLGGHCAALDFLVNFRLSDSGDDLIISGHPITRVLKKTTILQFCYSGCEVPQRDFIVGGFSVAKLADVVISTTPEGGSTDLTALTMESTSESETGSTQRPSECQTFTNAVECPCEWSIPYGVCSKGPLPCPKGEGWTTCFRGKVHYGVGGVLCQSAMEEDTGDCEFDQEDLVIAVNLNGPEVEDSKLIKHQMDNASLFTDLHKTRQPITLETWERSQCPDGVFSVDLDDEELYTTAVIGRSDKAGMGRCITYNATITEEGRYEFNVRTVESYWSDSIGSGLKPRKFNVRLNGKLIYQELNILRKVDVCDGLSLITEFDVTGNGLTPRGFATSTIAKDRVVNIDFCYGDGTAGETYDPNYIVASFYILRLKSSQVTLPSTMPPTPQPPTPTPSIATEFMSTITTEPTPTAEPGATLPPVLCSRFKNAVECKRNGKCEYSVAMRKCVPLPEGKCPSESYTTCQRGNGWYSVGGVLCKSTSGAKDQGDCKLKNVVVAVNLNGPPHNDSREIPHEGDMSILYTDDYYTRQGIQVGTWERSHCPKGVNKVPGQDKELYSSLIVGRADQWGQGRCLSYQANLTKDGRYELNVRTLETYWSHKVGNGAKPRQFNIRLNGVLLFPELNILHKVKLCEGMNLFAEFDVTEGQLTPAGYQRSSIPGDGLINIEFCYGEGEPDPNYDPNYIASSFYIVELNPSDIIIKPPPTLKPTKSTTTATTTTTEVITTLAIGSPTPFPPPPSVTCPEWETEVDCSRDDCDWICPDGPCLAPVVPTPSCTSDTSITSCRRGYAYYKVGDIVCVTVGNDRGNCTVGKGDIAIAVNLNGPPHTDSHGIPHEGEMSIKYSDPHHTRQGIDVHTWPSSQCKSGVKEIPHRDKVLYQSMIVGKTEQQGHGSCISYQGEISKEGSYEFNVRTVETFWTDEIGNGFRPRRFNIKLNGQVIWNEFHILRWVEPCQGIELFAEFSVKDKVLKFAGCSSSEIADNNIVNVEFCYGAGESSPRYDPNYLISSFYILRLPEADRTTTEMPTSTIAPPLTTPFAGSCKVFDNAVDCNMVASCEYNIALGICQHRGPAACPKDSFLTKCRRGNNALYVVGGVICKSHKAKKNKGNCNEKSVAIGVNFNGPDHNDSRSIPHVADATYLFTDKHFTRDSIHIETWNRSQCKEGVTGIAGQDKKLYSSLIVGRNLQRGHERCISYHAKIPKNGRFEFSFRTVETFWSDNVGNGVKPRYFNVLLNGQLVLTEFNILRLVKPCQGLELFFEFDVTNGKLTPAGLWPSAISPDGNVDVDFCYGNGEVGTTYDPNYIGTSFYIIELTANDKVKPNPPPTQPTTTGSSTASTTPEALTSLMPETTTDTTGTEDPCVTPKPGQICFDLRGAVDCKKQDCEFKISNRNCLPPPPSCGNRKSLTTCRRGNAFYVVDGVNCKSHDGDDQGNCNVLAVVLAVNLFGKPQVDSRGIPHIAEETRLYTDMEYTRTQIDVNKNYHRSQCKDGVTGVPDQDKGLYSTVIVGNSHRRQTGRCIAYHANITKDGAYEFNVRTSEFYWGNSVGNGAKPRQFNIRLNGMVIWPELNILYKVPLCQGLNLLSEFKVKHGLLKPAGLPAFRIINGSVDVEFCYGRGMGSDRHDTNYLISSFYIVQLPSVDKPAITTTTTPSTTTEQMETELTTLVPPDSTTWPGPATLSPGVKNCSILTNAVECKTAGDAECEYNLYNGTCFGRRKEYKPVPSGLTSCRRGNKAWYAISGLLYQSHQGKDQGNCKIKHVAIGVNINGPAHTDSRSVPHVADMTYLYTDKNDTRQPIHVQSWNRSQCKNGVTDILDQDKVLFSSLILGRNEKRGKGSCISYHPKITKDGMYELNIRTVETFWSQEIGNGVAPRYFNVRLNGKRVLAEFNILRKVKVCQGMDIIIEFEVRNGLLNPAGLTSSPISSNGRVNLDFCYGDGVAGRRYDPNYIVSSFYIVGLFPADDPMTPPPTLPPTTTEVFLSTITTEPTETTESPDCSVYNNKPVTCKLHKGEYSVPDGICSCGAPVKKCTNDSSLTCCRRGNAFYSVGGITCVSPYNRDQCNCPHGEGFDVVIAVNLNGPEHTDFRNISHVAERSDQYTDIYNTRHPIHAKKWKHSQCKKGITAIHPNDKVLFNSLILARNEVWGKGKCISYHANIRKNGRFEFNVRTAETYWSDKIGNGAKPRYFNIYLNGVLIWVEFNILHYVTACEGVELFAEFDVTDGMLTHAGSRSSSLGKNGRFEIKFCYGSGVAKNAVYDPNYLISSFYIIELPSANKPMPTLPPTISTSAPTLSTTTKRASTTTKKKRTTTTASSTTTPKSILSTTMKPVTPGPTPTIKPRSCDGVNEGWDRNFCGCIDHENLCDVYFQAVATTGKFICRTRKTSCDELAEQHQRNLFPGKACRRARGTYSYGGLICNNENFIDDIQYTRNDIGDCVINKTVLAVRFNGDKAYTDVRSITYTPMSKIPPHKGGYKLTPVRLRNGKTLCHDSSYPKMTYLDKDHELWEYYATGTNTTSDNCFNYTFPTPEDGTYELSVKTTEYEYESAGSRAFNIYLHGIGVFREVESNKLWREACFASELISVFEVTTDLSGIKSVTPRGFPHKPIQSGEIEIAFCKGTCSRWAKSIEFTGAAFSIVKLQTYINELDY